jgi:hypothetical protein
MRNTLLVASLVAVFIPAAFTQSPAAKPLPAFDQELIGVQTRFFSALQQKDVAYAERTVAADFQGVDFNGDFFGRGDLIDAARDGRSSTLRIYEVRVVRLGPDCAAVSYTEISPGEHPRYRHITDTWAKESGEWRLRFQQRTPRLWSALDLD